MSLYDRTGLAQDDAYGHGYLGNISPQLEIEPAFPPRADTRDSMAALVEQLNRKHDAHDAIMGLQDHRTDAWVAVSYRMPFLADHERSSLLARINAHYAAEIAGCRT
jgi:hypothetical protein